MQLLDAVRHSYRVRRIKSKIRLVGAGPYQPGNSSKPGHLYNPLPFPAFDDVPAQREACEPRFEMIRANLPAEITSGRVLDIGCNAGFNCFKFAQLGFSCVGIECEPLTAEIAQDVAALYAPEVTVICAEATPAVISGLGEFRVALFLATFQWITQRRGFEFACEALRAAQRSSEVLFFETSMGTEGRAKMPMLPDRAAVEKLLRDRGVHRTVEFLDEVAAPNSWLGRTRSLFRTIR
jgi:SAM-dependent methyltransferase